MVQFHKHERQVVRPDFWKVLWGLQTVLPLFVRCRKRKPEFSPELFEKYD